MFRIVLALASLSASAQWIHYPSAGIPRTPDGKPNLTAKTPRTADGKVDFSGMWLAGDPGPCPAFMKDDRGECTEKTGLPRQAASIGLYVEGGVPYQPWAAALVKQRTADLAKDDPHAHCLPPNFPRAYFFPHIQKTIQIPGLLVILDEFNASYRQIFTDGRPLPEDPQPSWNGYSSAKWQGDTLVVQTIGYRDDLWLDMRGTPLTNAGKVTERFRRPNFGNIEIEVTVDDPKAYTKPWTFTARLHFEADTELMDEICLEGERSSAHMK